MPQQIKFLFASGFGGIERPVFFFERTQVPINFCEVLTRRFRVGEGIKQIQLPVW